MLHLTRIMVRATAIVWWVGTDATRSYAASCMASYCLLHAICLASHAAHFRGRSCSSRPVQAATAARFPRGKHRGGDDIGADFYPQAGAYSSRNESLVSHRGMRHDTHPPTHTYAQLSASASLAYTAAMGRAQACTHLYPVPKADGHICMRVTDNTPCSMKFTRYSGHRASCSMQHPHA